jgi:dsRNA-specific ribonuclease
MSKSFNNKRKPSSSSSSVASEPEIFHGPRDEKFKGLIFNLLSKAKLKTKYLDILTNEESMSIYSKAFTSDTAHPEENYEVFEQLGDISANKFLVGYMHRRFPKLMCSQGVKVVARLRINYGAKQSFSSIAEKLGFWDFISASEEERSRCKKPLLEDTFEAFLGATEHIIDENVLECAGYALVYQILKSIFDDINISLKYEDLYDAKTRLKELFDCHGVEKLGTLSYDSIKNIEEKLTICKVSHTVQGQKIYLGEGTASLKIDAEQKAAARAIENLRRKGFFKAVPAIYSYFST